MAHIFDETELPQLVGQSGGRERIFFVNKELTNTDHMLAGVMRYDAGAKSPHHFHENCEQDVKLFQLLVSQPAGPARPRVDDTRSDKEHRLRKTT